MIFVPFLLRCFLEQRLEEFPRVGCWNLHDVLRPAGRDDGAAATAALGAEVDDVVGRLDDV